MSPRDWNAAVYDRVADPMTQWGLEVLDRAGLRGDETVLDAGCGSGRVTAELIERVPVGRVLACDAAPSMVELARDAVPKAEVFESDLLELELDEPVDVIVSTAVFHWIPDHELLFQRLHAALKPGGRLVAQCGGQRNIQRFHDAAAQVGARAPFAQHLAGWTGPWLFAAPEEAEQRLEGAGFSEIRTWLERKDVFFEDPRSFMRTVNLREHLARLPVDLHERYLDEVLELNGEPCVLEYVRLNIEATA